MYCCQYFQYNYSYDKIYRQVFFLIKITIISGNNFLGKSVNTK